MEFLVILILIILNGVFAMAEIAIITAGRSKLQKKLQEGDNGAQAALDLKKLPNRFLSTIQIGITLVGIFAGAYGGVTIAESFAEFLHKIPIIDLYADGIALVLVVSVITYLSLLIGELVPKRIALQNPVKIACKLAGSMVMLSKISKPLVDLLSKSTESVLKILNIKPNSEPTVSDDEIKILLSEGAKSGVFEKTEKEIVERTFKLSDRKVNTLMTPRKEIIWLEFDSSFKKVRHKIVNNPHAFYPVCRDSIDKVIGIVRTESLLTEFLADEKIDFINNLQKPIFIPESMDGLKVLEMFKKTGLHMALVVDEYGNVQGVISITDILEAIVGDIPSYDEHDEKDIVKRDDGTYLIDGLTPIDELKEYFGISKIPEERSGNFHTVGGFITNRIGSIPKTSDKIEYDSLKFEVMDMDGNRVDKVLITFLDKKN